jgi:hypothetical protein
VATLGHRCNVTLLIQSDDVRRKSATYYGRVAFGIVVRLLVEALSGAYVRGVQRVTSICSFDVNAWNVKGEMPPGHARVRDDARALDPAVRHTRRRCLWSEVRCERMIYG